jgi:hypothetical protein
MPFTAKGGRFAGRPFPSYRQYRNALARTQGYSSLSAQQRAPRATFSSEALDRLSPGQTEDRRRAMRALNLMRDEHMSLTQASHEAGISRSKAERWIGPALERRGGRYLASGHDRLVRRVVFNGERGQVLLDVHDSRTASKIAKYHAAVRNYLRTGDDRGLRRFRRQYVQSGKRRYRYITEPETLSRLFEAGELSFEDLYPPTT